MDDHAKKEIEQLLEYIRIKPTIVSLNTLYIMLKNYGYPPHTIPRLPLSDKPVIISKEQLENYIHKIIILINSRPKEEERKKNSSKDIYIFPESSMLPQNVYVSENKCEDEEEGDIDENLLNNSESENSVNSELEDQELEDQEYEDYEDDGEFSD